jgi:hypothetical protein
MSQAARVNRIYGHICIVQRAGSAVYFLREQTVLEKPGVFMIFIHLLDRPLQPDSQRKARREPDQGLAPGNAHKLAGQYLDRLSGGVRAVDGDALAKDLHQLFLRVQVVDVCGLWAGRRLDRQCLNRALFRVPAYSRMLNSK